MRGGGGGGRDRDSTLHCSCICTKILCKSLFLDGTPSIGYCQDASCTSPCTADSNPTHSLTFHAALPSCQRLLALLLWLSLLQLLLLLVSGRTGLLWGLGRVCFPCYHVLWFRGGFQPPGNHGEQVTVSELVAC